MAKKAKGPGGRPTKYEPGYIEEALELIGRQGKSITWFAKHLEVSRQSIYEWAATHPAFSDALERAKVWSEAVWEDRIQEMMVGQYVNAPLVKLYMANRFGWSDKQELTGKDGGPIETRELSDDALLKRASQLHNRLQALTAANGNGKR
jgi:hypothetical protein